MSSTRSNSRRRQNGDLRDSINIVVVSTREPGQVQCSPAALSNAAKAGRALHSRKRRTAAVQDFSEGPSASKRIKAVDTSNHHDEQETVAAEQSVLYSESTPSNARLPCKSVSIEGNQKPSVASALKGRTGRAAAAPPTAETAMEAQVPSSQPSGTGSATRPRRRTAELAVTRMRGKAAPMDLYKLPSIFGTHENTAPAMQQHKQQHQMHKSHHVEPSVYGGGQQAAVDEGIPFSAAAAMPTAAPTGADGVPVKKRGRPPKQLPVSQAAASVAAAAAAVAADDQQQELGANANNNNVPAACNELQQVMCATTATVADSFQVKQRGRPRSSRNKTAVSPGSISGPPVAGVVREQVTSAVANASDAAAGPAMTIRQKGRPKSCKDKPAATAVAAPDKSGKNDSDPQAAIADDGDEQPRTRGRPGKKTIIRTATAELPERQQQIDAGSTAADQTTAPRADRPRSRKAKTAAAACAPRQQQEDLLTSGPVSDAGQSAAAGAAATATPAAESRKRGRPSKAATAAQRQAAVDMAEADAAADALLSLSAASADAVVAHTAAATAIAEQPLEASHGAVATPVTTEKQPERVSLAAVMCTDASAGHNYEQQQEQGCSTASKDATKRQLAPLAAAAANAAAAAADSLAAAIDGGYDSGPVGTGDLVQSDGYAGEQDGTQSPISEALPEALAAAARPQQLAEQQLQDLRASVRAQPHKLLPPPPVIRIKQSDSPPPADVQPHLQQQQHDTALFGPPLQFVGGQSYSSYGMQHAGMGWGPAAPPTAAGAVGAMPAPVWQQPEQLTGQQLQPIANPVGFGVGGPHGRGIYSVADQQQHIPVGLYGVFGPAAQRRQQQQMMQPWQQNTLHPWHQQQPVQQIQHPCSLQQQFQQQQQIAGSEQQTAQCVRQDLAIAAVPAAHACDVLYNQYQQPQLGGNLVFSQHEWQQQQQQQPSSQQFGVETQQLQLQHQQQPSSAQHQQCNHLQQQPHHQGMLLPAMCNISTHLDACPADDDGLHAEQQQLMRRQQMLQGRKQQQQSALPVLAEEDEQHDLQDYDAQPQEPEEQMQSEDGSSSGQEEVAEDQPNQQTLVRRQQHGQPMQQLQQHDIDEDQGQHETAFIDKRVAPKRPMHTFTEQEQVVAHDRSCGGLHNDCQDDDQAEATAPAEPLSVAGAAPSRQQDQAQQQRRGRGRPLKHVTATHGTAAIGVGARPASAGATAAAAAAARLAGRSVNGASQQEQQSHPVHQSNQQLQQQVGSDQQQQQLHARQQQQQAKQQQLKQSAQQHKAGKRHSSKAASSSGDGWTAEEVQALQVAYCQVEPTHRFFWQEVAAQVGTRTAGECFAKIFDAARSPAPAAKLPRAKATTAPVLRVGADSRRGRTTLAQARKLVRGLQQEAQRTRVADPRAAAAAATAGPGLGVGLGINLGTARQKCNSQNNSHDSEEDNEGDITSDDMDTEQQQQRRTGRAAAACSSRSRQVGVAGASAAAAAATTGGPLMSADMLATLHQQQAHADRYISSFLRHRGGWNKYQKQQALLQQRQQRQAQAESYAPPAANSLGQRSGHMSPPASRLPAAAATAGSRGDVGGFVMQPPMLKSRDPRQGLASKSSLAARGLGGGSSRLTGAISKTLGVLTKQLGELEAVQAEEDALDACDDPEGLGIRDYYFDDEQVVDEDELLHEFN